MGKFLNGLGFAVISAGLLWFVWIYGNGLRDPRYLDGWMLAGGMGLQLYLHIAKKTGRLSPRAAMRWRKLHIALGFILIAAFVSHSNISLPDTSFEWALWAGFVLVTVSGIVGSYLAWTLKAKQQSDELIGPDRISTRRAELARTVHETVVEANPLAASIALPALPHDAWIMELYNKQLQSFFQEQRNFATHLLSSHRPLKQLVDEIDMLSRYVDQPNQEKLAAIKDLVVEKDRLDSASAVFGLNKAWQFIHVPVTYALIVLTVLHIIVVYAFSSGGG